MIVTLLPLLGSFHLRAPQYNSVTLTDILYAHSPDAVILTSLCDGELDEPSWQGTAEVSLPLAVVPWAYQQGTDLVEVGEPSPDPEAAQQFRRYLKQYAQGQALLNQLDETFAPLHTFLQGSVTLDRVFDKGIPLMYTFIQKRELLFEDGPGTDWLRQRTQTMATRIMALSYKEVVVMVELEHLPLLQEALISLGATLAQARAVPPSPKAQERALLDFAFRSDVPEPANVLSKLREIPSPEARYHEANILLANGHIFEAWELLERASQQVFHIPYFLPGFLLARLGQLRDLIGKRSQALSAYHGVMALTWAPAEARESAQSGLKAPFTLTQP